MINDGLEKEHSDDDKTNEKSIVNFERLFLLMS